MKRWIELATRLYPAAWRKRYGPEFQALIDDLKPGWRELFDVFGGALKMRLTHGATYLKFAGAFALFGLIATLTGSFLLPKQYVSTAVLRLTSTNAGTLESLFLAEQEVLSRTSLSQMIQHPSLNLYQSERMREPLEDVIERMRGRDIHITIAKDRGQGDVFRISFTYPSQTKAQKGVEYLITRFVETFVIDRAKTGARAQQNLEVLDPANLPSTAVGPNRLFLAFGGLAGGALAGLIVALFARHTRRSVVLASFSLAGCLLGVALSQILPQRYVSSAVFRIPPSSPLSGTPKGAEWLEQSVKNVLSRPVLTELILDQHLYREELATHPLEEVLDRVRNRDLHIQLQPVTSIRLEFAYYDREKTQAMLMAVYRRLNNPEPGTVELLDAPSYPSNPRPANRIPIPVMGLAAGLALGTILLVPFRKRAVQ